MLKRFILLTLCTIYSISVHAETCYPKVDPQLPQYIIGYGSLIQKKSKNMTLPHAGENLPILLTDYRRGWFAKGLPIGFSTTFLGAIEDKNTRLNGVLFKLGGEKDIAKYDEREGFYCRKLVPPEKIKMLAQKSVPQGQHWIYINKPESIAKPSTQYPIVQSYVDVFLSGCFEIQEKYGLKTFASDCVDTTYDWSTHWVNDRIYPRRPWVYEPQAVKIDQLLSSKLNSIFTKIKIE